MQGTAGRPQATAGGAGRTMIFGVYEGEALAPLSSRALNAFRDQLREDLAGEAVGDRQCWRFKLEGDKLTFDVEVLEGNLAGGDGSASVFLDIINLPLARRTAHRAAWYAGAQ